LSKPTVPIYPTIVEEGLPTAAVPPSTAGKVGTPLSSQEIAERARKKLAAESTASKKSYAAMARA